MRAFVPALFIAFAGSGCHGPSSWSAPMPEVNATPQATMYALHTGAVQSSYDTVVVARFITQWPAAPCTVQTMGDCTLTRCTFTDGGASASVTNVDAGTVTFTGFGGSIALDRNVDPDPNFNNWYQADLGPAGWSEGMTFALQGTGGVAPAFMMTVPAAGRLSIVTPPRLGTEPLTFSRASGVHVTWKPVTAGTVQLSAGLLPGLTLTCEAPGSAGSVTIPPEALASLPATGAGINASLVTETKQTIGGWPFAMRARSFAEDDRTGVSWGGDLVLQ